MKTGLAWSQYELSKARFWVEPLEVRDVPGAGERLELKVGFVGSARLQRNLSFDCFLYPLTLDNYADVLGVLDLDFILLESTLEPAIEAWSLSTPDGEDNLKALCALARAQGVQVIFWDTLGHEYDGVFAGVLEQCSRRYSHDARRLDEAWQYLLPAIQPRLHNPYRHRADARLMNIPLLFDGMVDITRRRDDFEFLKSLDRKGLHVFDSRYTFFPNKVDELEKDFKRVMGYLSVQEAYRAYKFARYYLTAATTQKGQVSRLMDCLEAAACGCAVIDLGPEHFSGELAGLFCQVTHADLHDWLDTHQEEDWWALRQKNLRQLVLNHTYRHRLLQIAADVVGRPLEQPLPRISIFTPSNRPQLAAKVVEQFQRQSYPEKELVYVFNAVDPTSAREACRDVPEVHFYSLPPEMNIGSCMNFAVSKASGQYCVKMDDDDFYGDNYLLDVYVAMACVSADFWGKPPSYVYFESTDDFYFRAGANRRTIPYSFCLASEMRPHSFTIAGNTLGGTRQALGQHAFSRRNVGAVDSIFHDFSASPDAVVAVLDTGNMAVYRSADLQQHNWRMDENELKLTARRVGEGMCTDRIFW